MNEDSALSKTEKNFDLTAGKSEFRQEVASRIRQAAAMAGSGDALAEKTGIPRRTLETYISGAAEPKAAALARIADAVGVTVDWLLLLDSKGREPSGSYIVGGFDEQLLQEVIETLEEALQAEGLVLPPAKKAKLVILVYRYYQASDDEAIDMSNVIRFIDVAR